MNILVKAHLFILSLVGVYGALLAVLCLEPVQRNLIYLNRFRWAIDFSHPDSYGYLPGKVLPLNLTTPDGLTLGAWQVLPQDLYDAYVAKNPLPEGALPQEVFDAALASEDHPTVLYAHGNAATRAAANRVNLGRYMSIANYNFLIYDYRGFADSSPVHPTEEGLLIDARAAWDYLHLAKKVPADRIAVLGQSLGTGVSTGLVARLAKEGIIPRALVLIAPFASIPSLLQHFKLFTVVPALAPFRALPASAWNQVVKLITTKFDSISVINTIRSPILLIHALNDPTIPHHQSALLFDRLLKPFATTTTVKEHRVGGWGTVKRFKRSGEGYWGEVVRAEAKRGGHNDIQSGESSLRLIHLMIEGGYRELREKQ